MASASPILTVKLIGEENVSIQNRSISWTPSDKVESDYVINSTSTPKAVVFDNVEKVRVIDFDGNGTYTINITTGISSAAQTISFEVQDLFIFSPTPAFRNTISSITLTTTSSLNVTVRARIYGEV